MSLAHDLDALRVTGGQLGHERIRESGQGVVDRVADVAMIDVDAVGAGHELDHLAGVECPVDGVEGAGVRGSVRRERQRDLAQSRADRLDPRQVAGRNGIVLGRDGTRPVGALLVDDAALHEPAEGCVERRDVVHRETILGVVGVQEVEGVLEIDVVRVASADRSQCTCVHVANHNRPVDRLRARGYITPVTDKTYETGYDTGREQSPWASSSSSLC